MARSGAIIIQDNKVALIERVREEKVYYLFPGGKVEEDETLEAACKREIMEELGLDVTVNELIAEVIFNENHQYFYLCNVNSGIFGTGDGEEYSGNIAVERGTYRPVWMEISKLMTNDVRPKCVCEIIISGIVIGFPKEAIRVRDLIAIQSV